GVANAFLARLNVAGPDTSSLLYSTYLGGSGGDVAYDMATDADGNVYLTGYTLSNDFPISPDALQAKPGGGIDVFVSKLNLSAAGKSALLYSSYTGRDGINVGYGIAVSPNGSIAVGGQTSTTNIATTNIAAQTGFAGGLSDGFVFLLTPNAR